MLMSNAHELVATPFGSAGDELRTIVAFDAKFRTDGVEIPAPPPGLHGSPCTEGQAT